MNEAPRALSIIQHNQEYARSNTHFWEFYSSPSYDWRENVLDSWSDGLGCCLAAVTSRDQIKADKLPKRSKRLSTSTWISFTLEDVYNWNFSLTGNWSDRKQKYYQMKEANLSFHTMYTCQAEYKPAIYAGVEGDLTWLDRSDQVYWCQVIHETRRYFLVTYRTV